MICVSAVFWSVLETCETSCCYRHSLAQSLDCRFQKTNDLNELGQIGLSDQLGQFNFLLPHVVFNLLTADIRRVDYLLPRYKAWQFLSGNSAVLDRQQNRPISLPSWFEDHRSLVSEQSNWISAQWLNGSVWLGSVWQETRSEGNRCKVHKSKHDEKTVKLCS